MVHRRLLWIVSAQLAVAVLAVVLAWDFPTRLWKISPSASAEQVRAASGAPEAESYDVPHYLDYTAHWRSQGDFHSWHSAFWPPGIPLLAGLVIGIFGSAAFPRNMCLIAALGWLGCFLLWWRVASPGKSPPRPAWLFLLAPWLLPSFRQWAIGVGCLGSESFAGLFFALSLALFVLGLRRSSPRLHLLSVFALALAAYTRAEYELYGMAALLALMTALYYRRREEARLAVALLLLFFALTLPWKSFLKRHYGHFSMSLSLHNAAETEFWTESPPPYAYGGNTPCVVEPGTCREVQAAGDKMSTSEKLSLAETAFLRRPFAWWLYKIRFLDRFWFGPAWGDLLSHPGALLDGLYFIGCFLFSLYSLRRADPSGRGLYALVSVAFLIVFSLVYTFAHWELRYSFPLRLYFLFSPLAVMGLE